MYLIDVPPPTISGLLHMGHVFSYAQMDFLARFHMARGEVVYPFCFDNNGVPTARLAAQEGIEDPQEIEKMSHVYAERYRDLFSNMRFAFANNPSYCSLSDETRLLANTSLQDLLDKGYAYKGTEKTLWCPEHQIAVSQAEVTKDGRYERSGALVEEQESEGLFINMKDHLDIIRDAINQINWHPNMFKERLLRWVDGIQYDWSIARDRSFGVPIEGETGLVFDTWFISSMTPQLAWAAYQEQAPTLECPIFDLRFQGHDIIRTWALFTIVKSLYHNNQIPWSDIVVTGHALDPKGRKISKSAGNFVPPSEYIDKYGPHGVRYWAALNRPGTDSRITESAMQKGEKLVTKIRNAARFISMQTEDEGVVTEWCERWGEVERELFASMEALDWSTAISTLRAFFWNEFCSEWIEASKKRPSKDTLCSILLGMLDWFDMFLPGIKEEITHMVNQTQTA